MTEKKATQLAQALAKAYGRPYYAVRWGVAGRGRTEASTWRPMTHYEFEWLPVGEQHGVRVSP